ncbi:MAG: class I SAM-dependent methyltransferase [Chloroflexi bacterium]|nr:class I SAM-dependent methyltransferase [Chloroflexota bacterium]
MYSLIDSNSPVSLLASSPLNAGKRDFPHTMSHLDARRWNARYKRESQTWLTHKPKQLLVDFLHLLPSDGYVLDAASGVATNGLELARRGLKTIALDISSVGLALAKQRFQMEDLNLNAAVIDLKHLQLPKDKFDVILNFNFLERKTFPLYRKALKPGGWLLFETFVRNGEVGPHPEYYLNSGELLGAFEDFDIVHTKQLKIPRKSRDTFRRIDQLVARKPM